MRTFTGVLTLAITILITALWAGNVNAKGVVSKPTSEGTVENLCHNTDGCLKCNKDGSCFDIHCKAKGGCEITSYPPPKRSQPGGTKVGGGKRPVSSGNNPATSGGNNVTGYHPPIMSGNKQGASHH